MADLIDRQAAIDFIDAGHLCNPNEPRWSDNEIVNFLKSRPSAQPERKTGRWQYVDYGGFGNWHCTACRKICICNGDFDYCPNCGAKMDEEARAWDD